MQLVGSIIDDKYKVVSVLGAGGTGTVYAAEQLDLGRKVAIKVLNLALLERASGKLRFEREARILSGLEHKHLVKLYATGFYAGTVPYLLTEFLEGDTLSAELSKCGRLSWQRTMHIALQICSALSYVHAAGVIHRDLKPQNIFLLRSEIDFVKVLDFGLSKALNVDDRETITKTGETVGSPLYLSPEQCQGKRADKRSDIYSLACILYECIAARPPFLDDNAVRVLHLHVTEPPALLTEVLKENDLPAKLDDVILKGLQKKPEHRYQTAAEFAEAISALLGGSTINLELQERTLPSSRVKALPATLCFLLLLASTFVSFQMKEFRLKKDSSALAGLVDPRAGYLDKAMEEIELSEKATNSLFSKKQHLHRAASFFLRAATLSNAKDISIQAKEMEVMNLLAARLSFDDGKPDAVSSSILKSIDHAIDLELAKLNWNNLGKLYLLKAKVYGKFGDALGSYLKAARAFAAAGRQEQKANALKEAESILKSSPECYPMLEFTQLAIAYDAGNPAPFLQSKQKILGELSALPKFQRANFIIELGKLAESSGDLTYAEKCYSDVIKELQIGDGAMQRALALLCAVLEKQGKKAEAIDAYQALREMALRHTNNPLLNTAEDGLKRLRPSKKQVSE